MEAEVTVFPVPGGPYKCIHEMCVDKHICTYLYKTERPLQHSLHSVHL